MSRLETAAEECPFAFFALGVLLFTGALYLNHFGFIDYSEAGTVVRLAVLGVSALPLLILFEVSDHDPFDLVVGAFATVGVCFVLLVVRMAMRPADAPAGALIPWSAELLFFQLGLGSVVVLGVATLVWVVVEGLDRVAARIGVSV